MSASQGDVEDLLRELAPQVLTALVRRYGQFHLCEDASQEALLAAALQWPSGGLPENPRGWLITVASRRLMDQVRSEQARRTREELTAVATPQSELLGSPADAEPADSDDSLALLFGCCHPDLSSPSQIALTLRAVGGLSTAQIAAAFGVPEATMAQRIGRAKQTISGAGFDFSLPTGAAICAVDRPPTARRVSAIWLGEDRSGWQQPNSKASESSRSAGSASAGEPSSSDCGVATAISSSRVRRDCSLRT